MGVLEKTRVAVVFPGQGSQFVGMGAAALDHMPVVAEAFQEAEEATGLPLRRLCLEGPEEELRRTEYAQPAILTLSTALYRALVQGGVTPGWAVGHSLGEYTALVAAGAVTLGEAARLVYRRGLLMSTAFPTGEGGMRAILGLEGPEVEEICREASSVAPVFVANYNSPGQIVISGTMAGLERAEALARERGAKRVVPLEVSGPFHSPLMQPAAEALRRELEGVAWQEPTLRVVGNTQAMPLAGKNEIPEELARQLTGSVRWEQSVRYLIQQGVVAFIEVGPGQVLQGLIKRIDRGVMVLGVGDPETLRQVLDFFKGGQ